MKKMNKGVTHAKQVTKYAPSTTNIVGAAVEILEAEKPMTLRQCFYRLVSLGVLENTRAKYQSLSTILTKARNGRVERF
jgi:hypothetical protein